MSRVIHSSKRRRAISAPVWAIVAILAILGVVSFAGATMRSTTKDKARVIPPPSVLKQTAGQDTSEVAVFAGGCFWGIQGVYQHVKGVSGAVSGYAGGEKSTANYETIEQGRSGHAEAVQVTFDPRQVTYGRLLQIFFSVHDPTLLNRQGPDVGTQYRSAIFPANAEQEKVAKAYVAQLGQARVFNGAIVTTIEPDRPFYPAEDYHQDYLTRHPNSPYIVINDLPKIDDLKRLFPDLYQSAPVLVGAR
jgi:peptide-methionine (S)-S-oxide reductase